jgi:hypothetical protein
LWENHIDETDAVRTQANKVLLKTCRDISFEFIKDGYVIHRYSHGHNTHAEHKNYCFDDLGTENNLKYFGTSVMSSQRLFSQDMTFIPSKTFKPTSPLTYPPPK